MATDINIQTLQKYLDIHNTLRFFLHGPNVDLSRAQMVFLVYLSSVKIEPFKSPYLTPHGLTQQSIAYYFAVLKNLGYLTRPSRGKYYLTDKARTFHQAFGARLKRRQSQPFRYLP